MIKKNIPYAQETSMSLGPIFLIADVVPHLSWRHIGHALVIVVGS